MDSPATKPSKLRNVMVKAFVICLLVICCRFAYVVTIRGESCDLGDFCFFSIPKNNLVSIKTGSNSIVIADRDSDAWSSKERRRVVGFYESVFQDLVAEGVLRLESKSLCVETLIGEDVYAMREIGAVDSIGVGRKSGKPLVVSYRNSTRFPFGDERFDFVFVGRIDEVRSFGSLKEEVERVLRTVGWLVVHTRSNDSYSLNSFVELFRDCFRFVRSREIVGIDEGRIREIVMKKECDGKEIDLKVKVDDGSKGKNQCSVPGYKRALISNAEPLITVEPLKPWITLKRNIENMKYLPSMVDISFKSRYVYVDVGARSYGSSIGSWFRKQYPKQNRTFDVYAIEADKAFHDEYKKKKSVRLLPYAAWIRNETLFFEINHDPGDDPEEKGGKGKGMGRIKPLGSGNNLLASRVDTIKGFDFANWLKDTVSEKDFVVIKMDVEGAEFSLIPRLFETGAICLIDEIFLECHYNRWQRCCPGQRSEKYDKTYEQCLDLFTSLRESGVLVHQWW
ncbi:hypothetical protein Droror1_Dr00008981 [Drosera rotundifolia]